MSSWPQAMSAILAILLAGISPNVVAAQSQPQGEARTFVGDVDGLQSIGAKFVIIVAPDRRLAAFFGSNSDSFNQSYAKWYIGAVNGNRIVATANDGTQLTGTVQGNQISGTIGTGTWTGTVTQQGQAGIYTARPSANEVDVVISAPDGSWVGMAFEPGTGQLLRTWNSGTGTVERVANATAIRVRPAPDQPPQQLDLLVPEPGGAFYNEPWESSG